MQAKSLQKEQFSYFPLWLSELQTPTGIREDAGLIPGLAQWTKDLALLWLCPAALAPVGPPAWELSYATGAALKEKTNKQKIKMTTKRQY